jgi:uncharacterized protein YbaR (Trm112 family)
MQKIQQLAYLRCPNDHSELTLASDDVVRKINTAIRSGRTTNLGGRTLREAIDAGLIRARGDVLYPVVHGIPLLLRDEAIPLDRNLTK